MPLNKIPQLSPASPISKLFLKVSRPIFLDKNLKFKIILKIKFIPVTIVLVVLSEYPTISISSPTLTLPYSIVPVTTVPLPGIVKVESTLIIKVLSIGLSGIGIVSSITFKSSKTLTIR